MKLANDISLAQFCEEMQYRVVKFPLNSLVVREALQFAKKHPNPELFRIATNKVLAQRQFQRELYGPGWLERVFDYLALGSLREVVTTLLLVGLTVVGIEAVKAAVAPPTLPAAVEHMDVDELARRLGLALETSELPTTQMSAPRSTPFESAAQLNEADLERITQAVLKALQAQTSAASDSALPRNGKLPASNFGPTKPLERLVASPAE